MLHFRQNSFLWQTKRSPSHLTKKEGKNSASRTLWQASVSMQRLDLTVMQRERKPSSSDTFTSRMFVDFPDDRDFTSIVTHKTRTCTFACSHKRTVPINLLRFLLLKLLHRTSRGSFSVLVLIHSRVTHHWCVQINWLAGFPWLSAALRTPASADKIRLWSRTSIDLRGRNNSHVETCEIHQKASVD